MSDGVRLVVRYAFHSFTIFENAGSLLSSSCSSCPVNLSTFILPSAADGEVAASG
jgi:hypothetical protein